MEEEDLTANFIAISCDHDNQRNDDAPVVKLQRFALDPSSP